jgi:polysaccharide export outer membrane protein
MLGSDLGLFYYKTIYHKHTVRNIQVSLISMISLVVLCACSFFPMQPVASNLTGTAGSAAQLGPQDYKLGPEDVIEIIVWKNSDLSRTVTVRPDGKISLPLVRDVQVAGNTVAEVTEKITRKLHAFYREPPQVSVIVQQVNSYAIYILGTVNNPGKYLVKTGTTFLQAMALAGGLTQFASGNRTLIRRRVTSDKETALQLRYKDVVSGKRVDVMLKAGDVIIVQ